MLEFLPTFKVCVKSVVKEKGHNSEIVDATALNLGIFLSSYSTLMEDTKTPFIIC